MRLKKQLQCRIVCILEVKWHKTIACSPQKSEVSEMVGAQLISINMANVKKRKFANVGPKAHV